MANRFLLPILLLLLLSLFLLNIGLGTVSISPLEVLKVLFSEEGKESSSAIILNYRMPQALTACLAGLSLGVAGLLMQTLFRNALAGPSVLGISSGASLGVALVMLAGVGLGHWSGKLMVVFGAVLGAGAVLFFVVSIARRVSSGATLLIVGLMMGYLVSAMVSILQHFSTKEALQSFVFWGFGSFSKVTWADMPILASVVGFGLMLSIFLLKPLNGLLLGEAYARSMGIEVNKVRSMVILSSGILTAVITAYCGPIAFLGLAVPHFARLLIRNSNHRILLPTTALVGACLGLACNLVARVPGSSMSLPLNAVTSMVGAPLVIFLVLGARKRIQG